VLKSNRYISLQRPVLFHVIVLRIKADNNLIHEGFAEEEKANLIAKLLYYLFTRFTVDLCDEQVL
jgi:hypothetical protein